MRDYTPEMINVIALGFVVSIGTCGSLTALGSAILPSSAFGYNRCALATFVNTRSGGMLDYRPPQMLAVGSDLDADGTPPIVSMSPNHKGATEHFTPLDDIIADEVTRGWICEGSQRPHYWPAHVSPVSCVPKPGTGKFRKVGDYENPRNGKAASALGFGDGASLGEVA